MQLSCFLVKVFFYLFEELLSSKHFCGSISGWIFKINPTDMGKVPSHLMVIRVTTNYLDKNMCPKSCPKLFKGTKVWKFSNPMSALEIYVLTTNSFNTWLIQPIFRKTVRFFKGRDTRKTKRIQPEYLPKKRILNSQIWAISHQIDYDPMAFLISPHLTLSMVSINPCYCNNMAHILHFPGRGRLDWKEISGGCDDSDVWSFDKFVVAHHK